MNLFYLYSHALFFKHIPYLENKLLQEKIPLKHAKNMFCQKVRSSMLYSLYHKDVFHFLINLNRKMQITCISIYSVQTRYSHEIKNLNSLDEALYCIYAHM